MFSPIAAFSGFSVHDLTTSKAFYSDVLGLTVTQDEMGLQLHLPNNLTVFIYEKESHRPATFTVLNLVVSNIDEAIEELKKKGVTFEHYDMGEMKQDDKGVLRGIQAGMGPDIAWFTDPSGNIFSVLQEK